MAVRRFYAERLDAEELTLDADQSAHARKTLRLGTGDAIEVFDGAGTVARCRITAMGRGLALIVEQRWTQPRPEPRVDLAVPAPKGARADTLVEMATQLGVDRLIWLRTARSVVEPSDAKRQRFHRLAIEAAKQCRRAHLLAIEPADGGRWSAVLADPEPDLRLIAAAPPADGEASQASEADAVAVAGLQSLHAAGNPPWGVGRLKGIGQVRHVRVLVGPEGGWTESEMRDALAHGYHPWRLNRHVLRVETAALAAAAIVRAAAESPPDGSD